MQTAGPRNESRQAGCRVRPPFKPEFSSCTELHQGAHGRCKNMAELSEDLGGAMVGINEDEIKLLMAERGK